MGQGTGGMEGGERCVSFENILVRQAPEGGGNELLGTDGGTTRDLHLWEHGEATRHASRGAGAHICRWAASRRRLG